MRVIEKRLVSSSTVYQRVRVERGSGHNGGIDDKDQIPTMDKKPFMITIYYIHRYFNNFQQLIRNSHDSDHLKQFNAPFTTLHFFINYSHCLILSTIMLCNHNVKSDMIPSWGPYTLTQYRYR
jgi:hypothetical protein